jgi:hypothetical protein
MLQYVKVTEFYFGEHTIITRSTKLLLICSISSHGVAISTYPATDESFGPEKEGRQTQSGRVGLRSSTTLHPPQISDQPSNGFLHTLTSPSPR